MISYGDLCDFMKELFNLIFSFRFKALFFEPTDNEFIKFFRYCFIGGIAFIADYGTFSAVCLVGGNTNIITVTATIAGFIVGLIVNFIISKKLVFTENAENLSTKGEFLGYTVIGIIGAGLNVLLMLIMTDWIFSVNRYIAKIIVAVIVLAYNYFARKFILYKK